MCADPTLTEAGRPPAIDHAEDEFGRPTFDTFGRDTLIYGTVQECREFTIRDEVDAAKPRSIGSGNAPEVAAAVANPKNDNNPALVLHMAGVMARRCNSAREVAAPGVRIQPDHPADDLVGILRRAGDRFLYGRGDAPVVVAWVAITAAILRRLVQPIAINFIPKQARDLGVHRYSIRRHGATLGWRSFCTTESVPSLNELVVANRIGRVELPSMVVEKRPAILTMWP